MPLRTVHSWTTVRVSIDTEEWRVDRGTLARKKVEETQITVSFPLYARV